MYASTEYVCTVNLQIFIANIDIAIANININITFKKNISITLININIAVANININITLINSNIAKANININITLININIAIVNTNIALININIAIVNINIALINIPNRSMHASQEPVVKVNNVYRRSLCHQKYLSCMYMRAIGMQSHSKTQCTTKTIDTNLLDIPGMATDEVGIAAMKKKVQFS